MFMVAFAFAMIASCLLGQNSIYVDPTTGNDYTWGNYLTLHPLRSILDPALHADMLQSYVRMKQQVLARPWFSHSDLVRGGTFELEMGPRPEKLGSND